MPEAMARPWLPPFGVLPWMRLKAVGWSKRGDSFKRSDDAAWYAAPYPHRLWEPLGTWVDLLEKNQLGGNVNWDQELADGKPAAIARAMTETMRELTAMQKVNADLCESYLVPLRRGVTPPASAVCMAEIEIANRAGQVKKSLPLPSGAQFPWWGWLVIGYLVTRRR